MLDADVAEALECSEHPGLRIVRQEQCSIVFPRRPDRAPVGSPHPGSEEYGHGGEVNRHARHRDADLRQDSIRVQACRSGVLPISLHAIDALTPNTG
jgi:hypothetical protein